MEVAMSEQDTERKPHEDELREAPEDLEVRDVDADEVTGGKPPGGQQYLVISMDTATISSYSASPPPQQK
jgi:hypothetical protein